METPLVFSRQQPNPKIKFFSSDPLAFLKRGWLIDVRINAANNVWTVGQVVDLFDEFPSGNEKEATSKQSVRVLFSRNNQEPTEQTFCVPSIKLSPFRSNTNGPFLLKSVDMSEMDFREKVKGDLELARKLSGLSATELISGHRAYEMLQKLGRITRNLNWNSHFSSFSLFQTNLEVIYSTTGVIFKCLESLSYLSRVLCYHWMDENHLNDTGCAIIFEAQALLDSFKELVNNSQLNHAYENFNKTYKKYTSTSVLGFVLNSSIKKLESFRIFERCLDILSPSMEHICCSEQENGHESAKSTSGETLDNCSTISNGKSSLNEATGRPNGKGSTSTEKEAFLCPIPLANIWIQTIDFFFNQEEELTKVASALVNYVKSLSEKDLARCQAFEVKELMMCSKALLMKSGKMNWETQLIDLESNVLVKTIKSGSLKRKRKAISDFMSLLSKADRDEIIPAQVFVDSECLQSILKHHNLLQYSSGLVTNIVSILPEKALAIGKMTIQNASGLGKHDVEVQASRETLLLIVARISDERVIQELANELFQTEHPSDSCEFGVKFLTTASIEKGEREATTLQRWAITTLWSLFQKRKIHFESYQALLNKWGWESPQVYGLSIVSFFASVMQRECPLHVASPMIVHCLGSLGSSPDYLPFETQISRDSELSSLISKVKQLTNGDICSAIVKCMTIDQRTTEDCFKCLFCVGKYLEAKLSTSNVEELWEEFIQRPSKAALRGVQLKPEQQTNLKNVADFLMSTPALEFLKFDRHWFFTQILSNEERNSALYHFPIVLSLGIKYWKEFNPFFDTYWRVFEKTRDTECLYIIRSFMIDEVNKLLDKQNFIKQIEKRLVLQVKENKVAGADWLLLLCQSWLEKPIATNAETSQSKKLISASVFVNFSLKQFESMTVKIIRKKCARILQCSPANVALFEYPNDFPNAHLVENDKRRFAQLLSNSPSVKVEDSTLLSIGNVSLRADVDLSPSQNSAHVLLGTQSIVHSLLTSKLFEVSSLTKLVSSILSDCVVPIEWIKSTMDAIQSSPIDSDLFFPSEMVSLYRLKVVCLLLHSKKHREEVMKKATKLAEVLVENLVRFKTAEGVSKTGMYALLRGASFLKFLMSGKNFQPEWSYKFGVLFAHTLDMEETPKDSIAGLNPKIFIERMTELFENSFYDDEEFFKGFFTNRSVFESILELSLFQHDEQVNPLPLIKRIFDNGFINITDQSIISEIFEILLDKTTKIGTMAVSLKIPDLLNCILETSARPKENDFMRKTGQTLVNCLLKEGQSEEMVHQVTQMLSIFVSKVSYRQVGTAFSALCQRIIPHYILGLANDKNQMKRPIIGSPFTRADLYELMLKILYYQGDKEANNISNTLFDLNNLIYWRTTKKSHYSLSPGDEVRVHPSGIENLGCTCYMNALLQQVFFAKKFRRAVIECDLEHAKTAPACLRHLYPNARPLKPKKNGEASKAEKSKGENEENDYDEDSHEKMMTEIQTNSSDDDSKEAEEYENILHEMQVVFTKMLLTQSRSINVRGLCKVYREYGEPLDVQEQKDAFEFFTLFCDKLETNFKDFSLSNAVEDCFTGELLHELKPDACEHSVKSTERFLALTVVVKETLEKSLAAHFVGEKLDGDNAYHCEGCGQKMSTSKTTRIQRLPNTLVVVLKRFDYNLEYGYKIKINDSLKFPLELELGQFLTNEVKEKMRKNDDAYELTGIVMHVGSADGGHYISAIFQKATEKWLLFDDEKVSEYPIQKLMEDAYGSEIHGKSAYILFYSKKDAGESDMTSLIESEIDFSKVPQSLVKTIAEKNMKKHYKRVLCSNSHNKLLCDLARKRTLKPLLASFHGLMTTSLRCLDKGLACELLSQIAETLVDENLPLEDMMDSLKRNEMTLDPFEIKIPRVLKKDRLSPTVSCLMIYHLVACPNLWKEFLLGPANRDQVSLFTGTVMILVGAVLETRRGKNWSILPASISYVLVPFLISLADQLAPGSQATHHVHSLLYKIMKKCRSISHDLEKAYWELLNSYDFLSRAFFQVILYLNSKSQNKSDYFGFRKERLKPAELEAQEVSSIFNSQSQMLLEEDNEALFLNYFQSKNENSLKGTTTGFYQMEGADQNGENSPKYFEDEMLFPLLNRYLQLLLLHPVKKTMETPIRSANQTPKHPKGTESMIEEESHEDTEYRTTPLDMELIREMGSFLKLLWNEVSLNSSVMEKHFPKFLHLFSRLTKEALDDMFHTLFRVSKKIPRKKVVLFSSMVISICKMSAKENSFKVWGLIEQLLEEIKNPVQMEKIPLINLICHLVTPKHPFLSLKFMPPDLPETIRSVLERCKENDQVMEKKDAIEEVYKATQCSKGDLLGSKRYYPEVISLDEEPESLDASFASDFEVKESQNVQFRLFYTGRLISGQVVKVLENFVKVEGPAFKGNKKNYYWFEKRDPLIRFLKVCSSTESLSDNENNPGLASNGANARMEENDLRKKSL